MPSKSANDPTDNPSVSAVPLQSPPLPYAAAGPLFPPQAASPLGPEHLLEIAAAQQRQKKVKSATSVAALDAWAMAFFGLITVVGGIFDLPSPVTLLIGLALCAVAVNSFRGHRMFKKLDLRGPRVLGFNQLFLTGAITIYAGWQIYSSFAHPGALAQSLLGNDYQQVLSTMGMTKEGLARLSVMFYGLVVAATWLAQGLTAVYYFTRQKHLQAYLESTPQWIHAMQRAQQP